MKSSTVRRPRIPNFKLPTEKEFNKMARGTYDGVDVSCIGWKDNKTVCLLSTYAGALPKTTIQRFDRKEKKRIEIVSIYYV
ncbi:hypothetical protein HUJ04_001673 [Dendroctonus ponderosae]|nr:hypothetical protein HUJ04_001673 [Dendroctonus ponderosae]